MDTTLPLIEGPFAPREMATSPGAFGKSMSIRWVEPTGENMGEVKRSRALILAARWQHAYALVIYSSALSSEKGTIQAYAKAAGVTYDRMVKVLRGEVPMRPQDVGMAAVLIPNLHAKAGFHLQISGPTD